MSIAQTAIALVLLTGSPAAQAQVQSTDKLTASEVERLRAVCELWGGIKYFHVQLAYREVDWDKALVDALPGIRAAATVPKYRAAVQKMLDALQDGVSSCKPLAGANPRRIWAGTKLVDWKGKVLFLNFAEVAASERYAQENPESEISQNVDKADKVVLDLRTRSGDFRELFMTGFLLDQTLPVLLSDDFSTAATRGIEHFGFPPQRGSTSGGYSSVMTYSTPKKYVGKAAARKQLVILVDSNAASSNAKLLHGIRSAGMAKVVLESDLDMPYGLTMHTFHVGDGVVAQFPISETVGRDGSIGFRPDLRVPFSSNPNDALERAVGDIPSALIDENGTAGPFLPVSRLDRRYEEMIYPSAEYRLLALFRYWNIIRYFHPYLDLIEADWGQILEQSIPRFLAAKDAVEYATEVNRLNANLNDTHSFFVRAPQLQPDSAPGIAVRYVESEFVVTGVSKALQGQGVSLGDSIVSVNGKPTATVVDEIAALRSISKPEHRFFRFNPLAGPKDTEATVVFRALASQKEYTVRMVRDGAKVEIELPKKEKPVFGMLEPEIGYIDLTRLQIADMEKAKAAVKDSKGLIFDMRGYPNGTGWTLTAWLAEKRVVNAIFVRPNPDVFMSFTGPRTGMQFAQAIDPMPGEKYKGKIVMLIDNNAISQSEHTCMMLRVARPDLVFVGTATEGANGDVTNFCLPGGIWVNFTGQSVRWPDGRQLQRVGIQPDVPCSPSTKGLLQGRDEVLERGIRELQLKVNPLRAVR